MIPDPYLYLVKVHFLHLRFNQVCAVPLRLSNLRVCVVSRLLDVESARGCGTPDLVRIRVASAGQDKAT